MCSSGFVTVLIKPIWKEIAIKHFPRNVAIHMIYYTFMHYYGYHHWNSYTENTGGLCENKKDFFFQLHTLELACSSY